jgi:hypothetical protein
MEVRTLSADHRKTDFENRQRPLQGFLVIGHERFHALRGCGNRRIVDLLGICKGIADFLERGDQVRPADPFREASARAGQAFAPVCGRP